MAHRLDVHPWQETVSFHAFDNSLFAVVGIHPAALKTPEMGEEDWEAFLGSVRRDGVREPVRLLRSEGDRYLLLDGRHRVAAVAACGGGSVPAVSVDQAEADAERYVEMLNVDRRHLTPGQKAAAAVELLSEGSTLKAAARRAGVTEPTVRRMKHLQQEDPEIARQVADGIRKVWTSTPREKAAQRAHVSVPLSVEEKKALNDRADAQGIPSGEWAAEAIRMRLAGS